MYSVHIVGRAVTVASPNGGEYKFSAYGGYDMEFDQDDLARVCAIMHAHQIIQTRATLTDAIMQMRNQKSISN